MNTSRRHFLQKASSAALGAGILSALNPIPLFAQTKSSSESSPARVFLDTRRTLAPLDRNLFGSFLEHLGRAIYDGIYDPGSKLSDPSGFRKDLLNEIRQLGVPIVRYPGGNFVSGYHWLDGVGPAKDRPRVLDKAWNSIESNQFGTNEFMAWCKAAGTLPLMGLNLGTGTPEEAAALVEYCNVDQGTKWSDLRRQHGIAEPHRAEHWCLGNEMDGPWQIGHMSATEYGLKAADAARQMRAVDPSLKLIACGSSGPFMPTYLEWDREVLEQCYDYVDGLSLHRYFGNKQSDTGGDSAKYLAMNLSMEQQITEALAVCDMVRGHKRSNKKLWLSFDEWNVWYRETSGDGHRTEAPHLLEEMYNLEDALLVGGLINTLLRNADRIKIACLAQLVNVIAPIMTSSDGLFRQTIYYPYSSALQHAKGAVLNLVVESPEYAVPGFDHVPDLDIAATFDESAGTSTLFILNRNLSKSRRLDLEWQGHSPSKILLSSLLTGDDLKAVNSFTTPNKIAAQDFHVPPPKGSRIELEVPARSYATVKCLLT